MAMHQFKAESKKLMDMMINSIYTNRDIFLRELISNASDACDKRYFKSLTDTSIGITKDDLKIHIQPDKEARTLTITDNGIGMTKEDLEKNLGTIAKSGSLDFKTENQSDNIDIIGQFGVGFYSAFMVAQKVTVISRAQGADTAWKWESKGVEGYTITEADKDDVGTEIILVLKDDTDSENYSEYLDDYTIANLVNLAIRVLLSWFGAPIWGVAVVWYAVPIGWLANFCISFAQYRTGAWRTQSLAL